MGRALADLQCVQVVDPKTKKIIDDVVSETCKDFWNGRDDLGVVRNELLTKTVGNPQ